MALLWSGLNCYGLVSNQTIRQTEGLPSREDPRALQRKARGDLRSVEWNGQETIPQRRDIGGTNWAHLDTSGAPLDRGKPIVDPGHSERSANVRFCPRPERFLKLLAGFGGYWRLF